MLSKLAFILATTAGATATLLDRSLLSARSLGLPLVSRQTLDPSTFPDQCKTTCIPIANILNTCVERPVAQQRDCFCTANNGNELENCVNCLVRVGPSAAVIGQGQELLDNFDQLCASYGLPKHTVDAPGSASSTPSASAPTHSPSLSRGTTPPSASATVTSPTTTPRAPSSSPVITGDDGPAESGNPIAPANGASPVANGVFGAVLGAMAFAIFMM